MQYNVLKHRLSRLAHDADDPAPIRRVKTRRCTLQHAPEAVCRPACNNVEREGGWSVTGLMHSLHDHDRGSWSRFRRPAGALGLAKYPRMRRAVGTRHRYARVVQRSNGTQHVVGTVPEARAMKCARVQLCAGLVLDAEHSILRVHQRVLGQENVVCAATHACRRHDIPSLPHQHCVACVDTPTSRAAARGSRYPHEWWRLGVIIICGPCLRGACGVLQTRQDCRLVNKLDQ